MTKDITNLLENADTVTKLTIEPLVRIALTDTLKFNREVAIEKLRAVYPHLVGGIGSADHQLYLKFQDGDQEGDNEPRLSYVCDLQKQGNTYPRTYNFDLRTPKPCVPRPHFDLINPDESSEDYAPSN